jgi:hypothetical protein
LKFQKQIVNGINYKVVYQVDAGKKIIVSLHKPLPINGSNEDPLIKSVEAY